MASPLEAESKLTDRYQTTVPGAVRKALKLGKRDKIRYQVQADGSVVMTRAEKRGGSDPVLGAFLDFLARDMARHPHRIKALDKGLAGRVRSLVKGVEVDLDAPLPDDGE